MKQKTLIILLILLVIPLISAEEIYQIQSEINFTHTITSSDEPVSNIVANITITDPRGEVIVSYQPMTFDTSTKKFNYTLSSTLTTKEGTYERCIYATNTTNWKTSCFDFELTRTGSDLDVGRGVLYLIILLLICGMFGISLFFAIRLPMKSPRNEFGEIIEINWVKYLKLFLFGLTYMFLVWIVFFAWNLSHGFLGVSGLTTSFRFLFLLLYAIGYPVAIFIIITMVINFMSDRRMQKWLNWGASSLTP